MEIAHCVVALVDVLGFKDLWDVKEENIVKIQEIYEELIDITGESLVGESVSYILEGGDILTIHVNYFIFSDTILIWQAIPKDFGDENSNDIIIIFLRAIQSLFLNAINCRIPLRAGVAIGDCIFNPFRTGIIRFSPGFSPMIKGEGVFLGMPIVNAYMVENAQEWIGIGFHKSFINYIGINNCELYGLVKYDIPSKNKGLKLNYTLPWITWGDRLDEILREEIKNLQFRKDLNNKNRKKIILKYENTLKYHEKLKKSEKFQGVLQIDN